LQALNREARTIIMVTHDDYVARHAKRTLRLRDGQLVSDEMVPNPIDALGR
jgi:putative ABC transport system ATP-binding protein